MEPHGFYSHSFHKNEHILEELGCLASDKEDGTIDLGSSWGRLDRAHLRAWSLQDLGKRLCSRDASSLPCFSVFHVCFPQKKNFFYYHGSPQKCYGGCFVGWFTWGTRCPPAPAVSVLQEKGPVAGFLNKSYFFWSKRKGSKLGYIKCVC